MIYIYIYRERERGIKCILACMHAHRDTHTTPHTHSCLHEWRESDLEESGKAERQVLVVDVFEGELAQHRVQGVAGSPDGAIHYLLTSRMLSLLLLLTKHYIYI
jgi:hypothetical protein